MNKVFCIAYLLLCSTIAASQTYKPDPIRHVFKKIDTVELALHQYLPANFESNEKYTTIMFVHGGGWNQGSFMAFNRQSQYFASRGLMTFSIEYRVRDRHGTTPFDAADDTHDAFMYLIEHADELNIDVNLMIVGGGSAGGHLATSISFWREVSYPPIAHILYNPVIDTGPGGYGHRRMDGRYKELSPIHNIDEKTPPSIILVGTKDKVLPVETANAYKAKVESFGGRCDVILYDGQEHAFFYPPKYFIDTTEKVDLFLQSLNLIDGKETVYQQYGHLLNENK